MLPKMIAVAQMRPIPGDLRKNLDDVLQNIEEAKSRGASLVVFPELCISGYLLGDRWEHDAFIRELEDANETIARVSRGITVVWGSVKADWDKDKKGEDGRVRKYNAAFIAQGGKLLGWMPKTNLPKYRIFDDARHFYPAAKFAAEKKMTLEELLLPFLVVIDGRAMRIGLAICEDLWEDDYNAKPSVMYHQRNSDLVIDISSSPWTAQKWHARDAMLRRRAKDAGCPILYVNIVGLQNNVKNLVWFDGASALMGADGEYRWQAPANHAGLFSIDRPASLEWQDRLDRGSAIEEIYHAIVQAMREFFRPFRRVVVGLSGGIDSAVSAALLVEALGRDRVLAVNMPTEYNSQTTKDLARLCARNLGIEYWVSSIEEVYEAELTAHAKQGYNPPMHVRENIQARARGHRLAGIAAEENGVFVCNGNKTEVALNYFTLYGDGAGAACFLADLWKGEIYALARLINEKHEREIIPQGILNIVPSAELSPEQNVDEGKGDPIFYPFHDKLMRAFIEKRWDPTEIVKRLLAGTLESDLGCEPGVIRRYFKTDADLIKNIEWCWERYNQEFKRHQLPPVFLASRRAFGFDRRDTIATGYLTDEYRDLAAQVLARPA
jgi:NAD+ synthase (glutamine-hydrolysing)